MAEVKNEKKKKVTTSKTLKKKDSTTTIKHKTNSKNNSSKNSAKKSTTSKKVQPAKKVTTKKVATTKSQSKKDSKKVVSKKKQIPQKKIEAKEIPKEVVKEISKEEQLEKTIIFDGRENQNLAEVVEKLEEKNVVLEDKVIKRSPAKKIVIIILTILIFVIIAATSWYVVDKEIDRRESNQTLNSNIYKKVARKYKTISEINKQEKKDKEEASHSIEEIKYSNIKNLSLADFERKILEKENMTVLIASSTCYPCLTFEPIINEVYTERNSIIYRINISLLSEAEVTRFRSYYAFKVTPTIFTIKDGIATAESTGLLSKEELISWLDKNA